MQKYWIVSLIIYHLIAHFIYLNRSKICTNVVSKRIQTEKKNKSYFCCINDQNRTFIFDAAQESVRCYHNEPKFKIFKTMSSRKKLIDMDFKQDIDKLINMQVYSLFQIELFGSCCLDKEQEV